MAKKYLLSQRDCSRIQAMLRWFERRRSRDTVRRRGAVSSVAGGTKIFYCKIVRGLRYADGEAETNYNAEHGEGAWDDLSLYERAALQDGYGQYIVRLQEDDCDDWEMAHDYDKDTRIVGEPEFASDDDISLGRIYICKQPHTSSASNKPGDPEAEDWTDYWTIETEIQPKWLRDFSDYSNVANMRDTAPWYYKGDIRVPLVTGGGYYHFLEQLSPAPNDGSIREIPAHKRTGAVVRGDAE